MVNVSFNDTVSPTPPTNLQANGTGPYTVALSWGAANDDLAVTGYRVSRNGVQVGDDNRPVVERHRPDTSTTYQYSVVAYDAANNVSSPATASGTTWAPDTQAPTAPTNLKATVAKSGVTSLTWTGSTDNFGVTGYRVYRNNALFVTVTATSYSAKKVRGTWTWYVVAYDQAGNTSAKSNSVTATVR